MCWQAETAAELSALEAEAELPIEELLARYRQTQAELQAGPMAEDSAPAAEPAQVCLQLPFS